MKMIHFGLVTDFQHVKKQEKEPHDVVSNNTADSLLVTQLDGKRF